MSLELGSYLRGKVVYYTLFGIGTVFIYEGDIVQRFKTGRTNFTQYSANMTERESVLRQTLKSELRQTLRSEVRQTPLRPEFLGPQDYYNPSITFRSPPLGLHWMGSRKQ